MKIRDIGIDTTNFNDFYNNSFNFKEIKSNYLSNLISFSFLKKVGTFYQWPFLCFSNLVENSIIHGKSSQIDIDINCYEDEVYKRLELATKNTNLNEYKPESSDLQLYKGDYSHKILTLSIKDNGTGIETELFNKILFCFDAKDTSLMSCINNNPNYLNKNINIKSCCLRLGDSFFILSKTKNELNIGLISRQLQMKMNNDLILTPLVNYTIIKNDDNTTKYIFKSQMGLQSENIILNEIRFLFWSVDEIFSYANSFETGTHIFIYDLKQFSSHKEHYNKASNFELFFSYKSDMNINNNDILYNTLLKQRYLNNIENDNENKKENENNENKNNLINIIDISLRKYLEFFLFEYKGANINLLKEKINVENNIIKKLSSIVNNNLYSLENDYFNDNGNNNNDIISSENVIIIDDSFSLKGKKLNNKEKINIILLKGELYKGILIKKEDKDTLVKIINDTFNVNISDEINDLLYNNILIYLENRLVCRLGQNKFGDLPYFIKKQKKKEWYYNYMGYIELPSNGLYELNLLKSEFKDNSMISLFFSKINNLIKKLNK
jgi:hypothetical protein